MSLVEGNPICTPSLVDGLEFVPTDGEASEMYRCYIDGDPWFLKRPCSDKPGSESLTAREWLYWRFAKCLGLPVVEMRLVEPVAFERDCVRQRSQKVYTATRELSLGERADWCELDERDRASMVCWSRATTLAQGEDPEAGDRLRRPRPRDVFRVERADLIARQWVMLDFEATPDLWDEASRITVGVSICSDPCDVTVARRGALDEVLEPYVNAPRRAAQLRMADLSERAFAMAAARASYQLENRWESIVAGSEHTGVKVPVLLRDMMQHLLWR